MVLVGASLEIKDVAGAGARAARVRGVGALAWGGRGTGCGVGRRGYEGLWVQAGGLGRGRGEGGAGLCGWCG